MGEVKMSLLGKELVFSKETDLFNSLRKKYLMLSVEAKNKAEEAYDNNITSISDYQSRCRKIMSDIFMHYLQIGVLDIIRYKIYDIDEEVLKAEFDKDFGLKYCDAINSFLDEVASIDREQMQADMNRQEMISEAGNTVSGAFIGVSGNLIQDIGSTVQTGVEAAVINGLAAGGTALVTGAIRKFEKAEAEKDKLRIFGRDNTKRNITNGMEQDVFMLHKTIARLINIRTGEEHYYYPSDEEVENFEPVCRNILRGNFKIDEEPDLEREQIYRVLLMNPYELNIYCYIMEQNGGISAELRELMNYLCVDKGALANSYLSAKYDLSDYNTYEDIVEFEKVVKEEMVPFDVEECLFSYQVASKRETLYIIRRTFHDFVYDTIEERDFAEKQYYEFVGEGFNELELDELIEKHDLTYGKEILLPNGEYIRKMLLILIEPKMEDFQDTETILPYLSRETAKMQERNLTEAEIVKVLEKRYKHLNRKEKFNAGVAATKEKLSATADNMKDKSKELMQKIPFGKKAGNDEAIEVDNSQVKEIQDVAASAEPTKSLNNSEKVNAAVSGGKEKLSAGVAGMKNMFSGLGNKTGKQDNSAPQNENKRCPQCGNDLKATAKFCGKCGYRF